MQILRVFARLRDGARTIWSGRVGAALLAAAIPALAQYSGPAILSRGEAPAAIAAPQIRFQPFVSINANYNTGLSNIALTPDGQIASQSAFGAWVGWGVSGAHSWRHTRLGLNYNGLMSHYPRTSGFDSFAHNLMLGLTREITPRTRISLAEMGGMFTRNLTVPGIPQSVPFDPNTTYVPVTDYFDNRTYYFGSTADVIYQKSARLSFDFGGGVYGTYRRSAALQSAAIATARSDVQYRISRRTSLGAVYTFQRYTFTHGRGDSTIHMFGPSLSMRVNRWLELSGMVGAARIENKMIQSTPVDPAIAVLLGLNAIQQIAYRLEYLKVPTFAARASRGFRTGLAYVSVGHSVTPGNGLFDTSLVYTVTAGYAYTGLRRWSLNTQFLYSNAEAIGLIPGRYSSVTGNFVVSRRVMRGFSMQAQYSARQYSSGTYAGYNRLINEASAGLTWSPGEVPLRLW